MLEEMEKDTGALQASNLGGYFRIPPTQFCTWEDGQRGRQTVSIEFLELESASWVSG